MEAFEKLHQILDELEHFEPAVASEALRAEELVSKLVRLPLAKQLARVTDDIAYQQWGLCQRLLYEAEQQWSNEPELAHERATVAVEIADRLDGVSYHPLWVNDLRSKAHAYLANTCRIVGDFSRAEREFLLAERYLRRGVGSGRCRARVFSLKVSLLIDQGRCEEAEALLDRIEAFYEATDQRTESARTQLKRAMVLASRDAYEEAAEECAKACSNLDPRREPRLSVLARQNAVHYLVHAFQVARARALFDALPATDERMVALRRRWLEADLLRAEGRLTLAREAYQDVRQGYGGEGLVYAMALVALDEAQTAFELEDMDEVTAMIEEASILLVRAAAKHEALAVIRIVLRAIERQTLTQATLVAARRQIAALQPS
jgi:tetratricopeptide (TPR) repeat protein